MRFFLVGWFYRDEEKVAWRTMRVSMATKHDSGSVEVQGGQMRVIRISRNEGGQWKGSSGTSCRDHPSNYRRQRGAYRRREMLERTREGFQGMRVGWEVATKV